MSERGPSLLVIRQNDWSLVLLATVAFAMMISLLIHVGFLTSATAPALLIMSGLLGTLLLRALFRMSKFRSANVEVDERGVYANGRKLAAPDDLRGVAYLRPREDAPLLVYFPQRRFWKSFGIEVGR